MISPLHQENSFQSPLLLLLLLIFTDSTLNLSKVFLFLQPQIAAMEPSPRLGFSAVNLDLTVGPNFAAEALIVSKALPPNPTQLRRNSPSGEEAEDMKLKIQKLSEENRNLNEKLSTMTVNYNTLQNQLLDLMSSSPKGKAEGSPARKRKSTSFESDSRNDENGGFVAQVECMSSEDSFQRLRVDAKSSVSKICVKTDPSDRTSLVKFRSYLC